MTGVPPAAMPPDAPALRARQKRTLSILAVCLAGAGLLVLTVLDRIPLPLRVGIGLGDLIAGGVLLVLLRQKFS